MSGSSVATPLQQPNSAVNFFKACLLHASYDLKRSLYGPKIILIGASFILVWGLILRYVVINAAQFVDQQMGFDGANFMLENIGLEGLTLWPSSQLAVFWVFVLYLLPLVCISLSADILINDRSQKRLRFWQLRSHRLSLLFGRILSKFITLGVLMGLALMSCLVVIADQQPENLAASLASASLMSVCLMVSCLPFIALMGVIAYASQTPFRATLLAILVWGLGSVLINWLAGYFPWLSSLNYLIPGSQLEALRGASAGDCLELLVLPVLQSVIYVVAASLLWLRADV